MAWYDRVLPTIAVVAPTVAGALGGPLASMATNAVLEALGVSSTDEAQKAIANLNPEVAAKMRAADQQFIQSMEQMGLDLKKIEAADRASARQREIDTKDKTPAIMAYVIALGFFSCIALLAFREIPLENKEAFYIILGALSAAFAQIINYYYGSSTSSKQKDYTQLNLSEAIADLRARQTEK